jgi:hypothetical protein
MAMNTLFDILLWVAYSFTGLAFEMFAARKPFCDGMILISNRQLFQGCRFRRARSFGLHVITYRCCALAFSSIVGVTGMSIPDDGSLIVGEGFPEGLFGCTRETKSFAHVGPHGGIV